MSPENQLILLIIGWVVDIVICYLSIKFAPECGGYNETSLEVILGFITVLTAGLGLVGFLFILLALSIALA